MKTNQIRYYYLWKRPYRFKKILAAIIYICLISHRLDHLKNARTIYLKKAATIKNQIKKDR